MAEPFQGQQFTAAGTPTQEFYEWLKAMDREMRVLAPAANLKPLPPVQFPIVRTTQR